MELNKEENIGGEIKVRGHNDVAEFIKGAKAISDRYMAERFPSLSPPKFDCSWGSKYVKVFQYSQRENGQISSKTVYCFIDRTNGDIYKASSWASPAKHARGNIFAEDKGLGCCTPYGIKYLKGGIF